MDSEPKYKLLQAASYVVTCASCGHWLNRGPAFLGYEGQWDCDRCGCTSIKVREGRPYGPKSREWDWIVEQFNKLWRFIDECDDVITDPPFRGENGKRIGTSILTGKGNFG